jgi:hypothetical protein
MMPLAIAPPLLANGLDWLEALLPVLFVLFWILSQLVAVVKKVVGSGERSQQPQQPQTPPVRRPRPVAVDRGDRGELQDEIREFLRRELPDRRPSMPRPVMPKPSAQFVERSKEMSEPLPSSVSGESIAERVKQDFAKELEHLSTPLTADRSLASPQPGGAVAKRAPVAEVVRSLRSPATLRELVVIREILDRPVDRW